MRLKVYPMVINILRCYLLITIVYNVISKKEELPAVSEMI